MSLRRRVRRTTMTMAACVAILGGCVSVQSGNGTDGEDGVTDIIVFDLREPFTRDVAGMEPGERFMPTHADPGEVIHARIILPDGSEFTVDAETVTVVSEGTGSESDPPSVIYLRRPSEPLPDAYEHLLDAADLLDLDRREIDGWRNEAQIIIDGADTGGMSTSTAVWYRDEPFGDIQLAVEAATFGHGERISVTYIVQLYDLLAEFE